MNPLHKMNEGESVEYTSDSSSSVYEVRLRGGVYYCTCQGWKVCPGAKNQKTCKHLKLHLGLAFDRQRRGLSVDDDEPKKSKNKKRKGEPEEKKTKNNKKKINKVEEESEIKKIDVRVLLAEKWTEEIDPTGYWMSEKLDGVRALWNGSQFYSRNGNIFYAPDYFRANLPANVHLDGELFLGRKQFNETVSIVSSNDKSDRWKQIVFRVFDIPSETKKNFEERMDVLKGLLVVGNEEEKSAMPSLGGLGQRYAEVVPQIRCENREQLDVMLKEILTLGGEGVMLRAPQSMYEPKRSKTLLKVKTFFDEEAIVIGHNVGKNKYAKLLGSLKCKFKDAGANNKERKKITFNVGSGFSDEQRKKPPKIGSTITFKYQETTPAGVPRFPVFVGIPIDK